MYVTREMIAEAEAKYGIPKEMSLEFAISPQEVELIQSTRVDGRSHDVTVFAFRGDQIALIRKAGFPPGAYRAPSGGLHPGEPIDVGAQREIFEETALDISLTRYLLRITARFTCGSDVEDWITHVFCARVIEGEIDPIDTHEIEDARFGTIAELQGPIRDILLSTGRGLFAYRVALTDAAVEMIEEMGRPCRDGD